MRLAILSPNFAILLPARAAIGVRLWREQRRWRWDARRGAVRIVEFHSRRRRRRSPNAFATSKR